MRSTIYKSFFNTSFNDKCRGGILTLDINGPHETPAEIRFFGKRNLN